jgi:hypothetical protein
MWAEGPAISAASQRNRSHTSGRTKHNSEYATQDRSAAVSSSGYTTSDDNAANDGVWAGGQEEQQRQFAAAEVGERETCDFAIHAEISA